MGKNLVRAGLGFGIVSYCLVLLVSQDAPVFTVFLMGVLALFLIASSMWILWMGEPDESQVVPPELINTVRSENQETVIR